MYRASSNILRLIRFAFRAFSTNNPRFGKFQRQANGLIRETLSAQLIAALPGNSKMKMQWYMAIAAWMCELFNELHGRSSTPEEQRTYLLSSATMAISDVLIDDVDSDPTRLELLMNPAESFVAKNSLEEAYLKFYRAFLGSLSESVEGETMKYYNLAYQEQINTLGQLDELTPIADIDEVCRRKSGIGLLFFRAMIDVPVTQQEQTAWFELGAFLQYCNDVQDLYKDTSRGIRTFANSRPDLETVFVDLDVQRIKVFGLIGALPFDETHKSDSLFMFYTMYMVTLSKLKQWIALCDDKFSLEQLMSLDKHKARLKSASWPSFWFCFDKLKGYQETWPFETPPFDFDELKKL